MARADACAWVTARCGGRDMSVYLRLYYCLGAQDAADTVRASVGRFGAVAAIVVWLTGLFSALSLVASAFFCPNLSTIAERLALADSTIGVTLLALGNGAPDVVSTFRAMQKDAGTLALGELMGAAMCIIGVVCGVVMVLHSFRVPPFLLLRDAGMFALAVALTLHFVRDGALDAWEGLAMVALYVCYIVVVLAYEMHAQHAKRVPEAEQLVAVEDAVSPLLAKHSLLSAIEVSDAAHQLEEDAGSLTPTASSAIADDVVEAAWPIHRLHRRNSAPHAPVARCGHVPSYGAVGFGGEDGGERAMLVHAARKRDGERRDGPRMASSVQQPLVPHALASSSRLPPAERRAGLGAAVGAGAEQEAAHSSAQWNLPPAAQPTDVPTIHVERPPQTRNAAAACPRPPVSVWHVLCIALIPSLLFWRTKSPINKVISAACVPALFALRVTVPLVSREEFQMHEAVVLLEEYGRGTSPRGEAGDARGVPPGKRQGKSRHVEEGTATLAPAAAPGDGGLSRSVREAIAVLGNEESAAACGFVDTRDRAAADHVLIALQCMTVPVFALWALAVPVGAAALGAVAAAGALLGGAAWCGMQHLDDAHAAAQLQRFVLLRGPAGFAVGLLWIVILVDEVLAVLRAIAFLFGWSDAILGMTLFAMGNSLGDVVTNLSVARLGHPLMALSACFASPMANLLLGVGLSACVLQLMDPTHRTYTFALETPLLRCIYMILFLLVLLLVVVPLNGFRVSRKLGFLFLASYFALMARNVYGEWHGERWGG
ncbi:hypothetical protein MSPP1_003017 [Malassezia sp. CBS 17886]|nr:hypothetical protein MSPP1_003017 [Malassezia sp. CBS 17886]